MLRQSLPRALLFPDSLEPGFDLLKERSATARERLGSDVTIGMVA
jgi:hypothetical protein